MSATLFIWPAETLEHAEAMRVVRNSCRTFMTRSTHEISVEEQVEWFRGLDRDQTAPYIGITADAPNPMMIAYGLIRQIDGKSWLSGGLTPEWRGRGYGRLLFAELTRLVLKRRKTAWLEVRKDNGAAERVYRSLGFVQVEELDYAIVMRKDP